jgi:catechol 2,3-dioxygenase-like lactoylglutathione lyase family enzyme
VLQLDHVELFVPDRYEAARWYQRVLGLEIVREYEEWAADPRGPLMISKVTTYEYEASRAALVALRERSGGH